MQLFENFQGRSVGEKFFSQKILIDNKTREFGLDNVGIYYVNSESKAQI